jgi:hypothetical protein
VNTASDNGTGPPNCTSLPPKGMETFYEDDIKSIFFLYDPTTLNKFKNERKKTDKILTM